MMKRRLFLLIFASLVILLTVVIVFVVRSKKNNRTLILYGNVDVRIVDIGFRVPGRIDQIFFEEGDWVEEGQRMAVLDKTPYDSQVLQAEANVEAVQANYKNSESLLHRRKELIDIGGVSQEDLENAQMKRDQLWADLLQAKASLQAAIDNLCYTDAFAPTSGFILTRIREPGTIVNPADPVYTISVASPVWIRAYVDEPHLGSIYYGMSAKIYTDVKGGPVYTGQVGFISPMAEFTPKTVQSTELRTDLVYRLRVYAENPDKYLKQGMPVTVKLKRKRHE